MNVGNDCVHMLQQHLRCGRSSINGSSGRRLWGTAINHIFKHRVMCPVFAEMDVPCNLFQQLRLVSPILGHVASASRHVPASFQSAQPHLRADATESVRTAAVTSY